MLYCGTSGWSYPSWKPDFYPAKLASAKFLGYYAQQLNTVEINYTFRRLPQEKLLAKWIAETPPGFLFAPKAHQRITHFARLRDAAEPVAQFLDSLAPLAGGDKLGPVLLQLPPNLACDLERLDAFLQGWPRQVRTAMEFRHPSWFQNDVYDRLRGANVALCEAESARLTTPPVITADFCYFRFRRDDYTPRDVGEIGRRLRQPSGDVFAYFKHEETPAGARWAETVLRAAAETA